MNVETVKLARIKPDPDNARLHNDRNLQEIERSIKEFGQHRPFVVQRSTGKILVGNGMYQVMQRLGIKDGLVLYVDDDDKTAVKRALADNRTGELATWDDEKLSALMATIGDVDIPGWTPEEIDEIVADVPEIWDNSGNDDDRGSRTEAGKGKMVVSVGKMSTLFDYEKTQAICDAIREQFVGGEDDGASMLEFCEWLYSNRGNYRP